MMVVNAAPEPSYVVVARTFVVSLAVPAPTQAGGFVVGVVPESVQLAIVSAGKPRTLRIVRTVMPFGSFAATVAPVSS